MNSFILTIVILQAIRIVLNTLALANGWEPKPITPGVLAWRVVFGLGWLVWGICLLVKGAA